MPDCRRGFSLIELLIVLTMLAVIAAIVVPRLVDASDDARDSALATDLQMLRRQIQMYRTQHKDRGPHLDEKGNVDKDNLLARMTGRTDVDGRLNASGCCGPYLKQGPVNPFLPDAVAGLVAFGTAAMPPRDDKTGWYYNTDTCIISPNSARGAKVLDPGASMKVSPELPSPTTVKSHCVPPMTPAVPALLALAR